MFLSRLGGLLVGGLLLITVRPAHGQAPGPASAPVTTGTGVVTGMVLDSASREPVAFATIGLLPATAGQDKPLTGVAADENGRFRLQKLAPGEYRLRVSFVGYATQTRRVTVSSGATDAGTFRLSAAGQQLAEVTVTGQKPVVEVQPDRLVYNVSEDATNAGATVADALQKAPLLSLDADGKPQLRGSGNVRVLINNKPSALLATSVADALRQLPADQVERIEVITSPSAKYEAEGAAGIINIVLKKNNLEGMNGRASAATGNRNSNLNASINYRKGKVGVNASIGSSWWYGPNGSASTRTEYDTAALGRPVVGLLSQNGAGRYSGNGTFGTLALDFDPNKENTFNLTLNAGNYGGHYGQDQTTRYESPTDPTRNQLYSRRNDGVFGQWSYDLSGTYTRTFVNHPRREWSIIGQYSQNKGRNGYDADQYAAAEVGGSPVTYAERSRGTTPGHEITMQTDYVHPLTKRTTLETGAKAIWRSNDAVTNVDIALDGTTFVYSPARSTTLDYSQDVLAAYAIYAFSFDTASHWTSRVGTRLETAELAGRPSNQPSFSSRFTNLLPNVSLSFTPKQGRSATLTYTRRVQRPNVWFLNPFVNRADPRNIEYGNPDLDPEITDNVELVYNALINSSSITATGFARRTRGSIESIYVPGDSAGVTAQTFRNLASNDAYGVNLYFALKPLPKWDLSFGPNVTYFVLRSPALNRRNDGVQVTGNLNTSYQLPHDLSVQANGFLASREVRLQGTNTGWMYYNLGLKKMLFKGKGDLSANVSNPFTPKRDFRSTYNTPTFDQVSHWYAYQRSFRAAFSYRFGSLQQQYRQRKQVSNDDLKSGGGGQGQ